MQHAVRIIRPRPAAGDSLVAGSTFLKYRRQFRIPLHDKPVGIVAGKAAACRIYPFHKMITVVSLRTCHRLRVIVIYIISIYFPFIYVQA
ncbi:hypothetical protein Barb7_01838 [Bacteroidales bacterium Barb7]|nr:hypothetical protein Barb7_01838 [Bacteroidales bacterium Barb7]